MQVLFHRFDSFLECLPHNPMLFDSSSTCSLQLQLRPSSPMRVSYDILQFLDTRCTLQRYDSSSRLNSPFLFLHDQIVQFPHGAISQSFLHSIRCTSFFSCCLQSHFPPYWQSRIIFLVRVLTHCPHSLSWLVQLKLLHVPHSLKRQSTVIRNWIRLHTYILFIDRDIRM